MAGVNLTTTSGRALPLGHAVLCGPTMSGTSRCLAGIPASVR